MKRNGKRTGHHRAIGTVHHLAHHPAVHHGLVTIRDAIVVIAADGLVRIPEALHELMTAGLIIAKLCLAVLFVLLVREHGGHA
jgi:hypothetical protein